MTTPTTAGSWGPWTASTTSPTAGILIPIIEFTCYNLFSAISAVAGGVLVTLDQSSEVSNRITQPQTTFVSSSTGEIKWQIDGAVTAGAGPYAVVTDPGRGAAVLDLNTGIPEPFVFAGNVYGGTGANPRTVLDGLTGKEAWTASGSPMMAVDEYGALLGTSHYDEAVGMDRLVVGEWIPAIR